MSYESVMVNYLSTTRKRADGTERESQHCFSRKFQSLSSAMETFDTMKIEALSLGSNGDGRHVIGGSASSIYSLHSTTYVTLIISIPRYYEGLHHQICHTTSMMSAGFCVHRAKQHWLCLESPLGIYDWFILKPRKHGFVLL